MVEERRWEAGGKGLLFAVCAVEKAVCSAGEVVLQI